MIERTICTVHGYGVNQCRVLIDYLYLVSKMKTTKYISKSLVQLVMEISTHENNLLYNTSRIRLILDPSKKHIIYITGTPTMARIEMLNFHTGIIEVLLLKEI